MPKVFLSSTKNWSDTTLVGGTNCLIRTGSAVDAVKYQSLSAGSSYNVLERTGTGINNVQYKQETAVYSAAQNAQNAYNRLRNYYFYDHNLTNRDNSFLPIEINTDGELASGLSHLCDENINGLTISGSVLTFDNGGLFDHIPINISGYTFGCYPARTTGKVGDAYDITRGLYKVEFVPREGVTYYLYITRSNRVAIPNTGSSVAGQSTFYGIKGTVSTDLGEPTKTMATYKIKLYYQNE